MFRGRPLALALCFSTLACGYTPLAAETSALACSDGVDNDGDRKNNCDDPDCWSHAHCRIAMQAEPAEPAVHDPPLVRPPQGQLPPEPPPVFELPEPDAGRAPVVTPPDVEPDASAPLDALVEPECDPRCPSEACLEGVCMAPLLLGSFAVTRVTATVVREVNGRCLDGLSGCVIPLGPPGHCCTPPDPQVLMYVAGEKVGYTPPITNQDAVVWSSPGISLRLIEGDEVRFEVVDNDAVDPPPFNDEEPDAIFSCAVTATVEVVAARLLRCTSQVAIDGVDIEVEATASIAPQAPER